MQIYKAIEDKTDGDVSDDDKINDVNLNDFFNYDFNLDAFFNIPSPVTSLPAMPLSFQLSSDKCYQKELLVYDFMVNKIFPNCICYGGELKSRQNPYLNYIVPLTMSSDILFKALIAYSAKLYSLLHNKDFEDMAVHYKQQVLQELPVIIQEKSRSLSNWEEVLGTILLLCSSNISSDCDKQWIIHSEGAKKLLNKLNLNNSNLDPFKKFFIRYLTSHEIMRETVKMSDDVNTSTWLTYETYKNDEDQHIDLILGCSPKLLSIVNKITELGEYYESLEFEDYDNRAMLEKVILAQRQKLQLQLNTLRQYNDNAEDIHNNDAITEIALIKQLTAKIYLFARVDLIDYKLNGNTTALNEKRRMVHQLVQEILFKVEHIDYCTMTLIWPLFVVGIVTDDLSEANKWSILNEFTKMENSRGLASVKMARCTVELVWKKRDLNEDILLTWKDLTASDNDTISLI